MLPQSRSCTATIPPTQFGGFSQNNAVFRALSAACADCKHWGPTRTCTYRIYIRYTDWHRLHSSIDGLRFATIHPERLLGARQPSYCAIRRLGYLVDYTLHRSLVRAGGQTPPRVTYLSPDDSLSPLYCMRRYCSPVCPLLSSCTDRCSRASTYVRVV